MEEYPDGGEYTVSPGDLLGPLTLAELVDLLDEATYTGGDLEGGLALGWNNNSLDGCETASELRNFTSLESDLYPRNCLTLRTRVRRLGGGENKSAGEALEWISWSFSKSTPTSKRFIVEFKEGSA